jgi:hypothetical protein
MGNKGSTTPARRTHTQKLSTEEAWSMALTWRDQLEGRVGLKTDTERGTESIIRSLEWVTFVICRTPHTGFKSVTDIQDIPAITAFARAATIVWFALS